MLTIKEVPISHYIVAVASGVLYFTGDIGGWIAIMFILLAINFKLTFRG